METIKIKYFGDIKEEHKLKIIDISDWIDLRSSKTISIKKGESALIPLGVAMELPKGFEGHILSRSSTHKNFGIIMVNGMGIVDNSYCGDNDQWFFNAFATRSTEIFEGERIAQFRIVEKQPKITFTEVKELNNPDRGGQITGTS